MFHLVPFEAQAAWGRLKMARPLRPGEDGWGPFQILKGTIWERAFSVVSSEVLEHALRGYTMPLEKMLKLSPKDFVKTMTLQESLCLQHQNDTCPLRTPDCVPCAKMPDCYIPPHVDPLALDVALAIQEGRYPLIVRKDVRQA